MTLLRDLAVESVHDAIGKVLPPDVYIRLSPPNEVIGSFLLTESDPLAMQELQVRVRNYLRKPDVRAVIERCAALLIPDTPSERDFED